MAYNRRFYASTMKAREIIQSEGGVRNFHFEMTEWAHVIGKIDSIGHECEKLMGF